jgi:hypothetical protein
MLQYSEYESALKSTWDRDRPNITADLDRRCRSRKVCPEALCTRYLKFDLYAHSISRRGGEWVTSKSVEESTRRPTHRHVRAGSHEFCRTATADIQPQGIIPLVSYTTL